MPDYDYNFPPLETPALCGFLKSKGIATFQVDYPAEVAGNYPARKASVRISRISSRGGVIEKPWVK